MKIGIITQPLHNNYGGLLQNFALQEVLRRMGNEVVTLDQCTHKTSKYEFYKWFIKSSIKKILGRKVNMPRYVSEQEINAIAVHTSKFVERYIKHTKKLATDEEFATATRELGLEAILVGSDQVWRPIYNTKISRSFLDFTQGMNLKRIAYAASFGVDYWEYTPEQSELCSRLAKDFNAVSVREKDAISLCNKHLGVDATFVLDPTMLLDKEDYIKMVEQSGIKSSSGNLFTYILNNSPQKQEFIDKVASKLNLTPFIVMSRRSLFSSYSHIEDCIYPAVEQWLRAFMDAKFVICDSFHGAVFSIIFNKPFVVIGNVSRGMSRFNSLFELYSLKERLLDVTSDISIVEKAIDWEFVNSTREAMKQLSLAFIKDNLRK